MYLAGVASHRYVSRAVNLGFREKFPIPHYSNTVGDVYQAHRKVVWQALDAVTVWMFLLTAIDPFRSRIETGIQYRVLCDKPSDTELDR
jgi:hypothetical protein